jgi:hypothetical protein
MIPPPASDFVPCDFTSLAHLLEGNRGKAIPLGIFERRDTGATIPVGNDYSVDVDRTFDGLYTVQRIFMKRGRRHVMGVEQHVSADNLVDAAYRAGRFAAERFGSADPLSINLRRHPLPSQSDEATTTSLTQPQREGKPMPSQDNHAADYALTVARNLESRLGPDSSGELDILADVIELTADTTGKLTLVLTVGGPHAELVLGDGEPRIEVWWGGAHHTASVNLDERYVEDLLATWWRAALEAALNS